MHVTQVIFGPHKRFVVGQFEIPEGRLPLPCHFGWMPESIAAMPHRFVFGILYLILAVWGFVNGIRQKREKKDFRLLLLLGSLALMCAAEKIWSN
jgi:hypothetical protein